MKNILIRQLKFVLISCIIIMGVVSCEYEDLVEANYPAPLIYMPTAVNGNYMINSVPVAYSFLPSGTPARFKVDLNNKKLIIPLGVYRSGVNLDGDIEVSVSTSSDSINKLISLGKLALTGGVLASTNYSIASSARILNGEEYALFDLTVDLDFLKNNLNKIYALGVMVNSDDCSVNILLNTTIVIIDTKILVPLPDFSSKSDASNNKKIIFTNKSSYSASYSWDFGDGSTLSTETSPTHIYSAAGTYAVSLTAIGVTGEADKVVKTVNVVVP